MRGCKVLQPRFFSKIRFQKSPAESRFTLTSAKKLNKIDMASRPSFIAQIGRWLRPSTESTSLPKQPAQGFVELRDLHKSFIEGVAQREVLHDVSVTFEEGQFIVLLGQSGSGKSTLLNLISGIERPTTGTVMIDGVSITDLSERACTLFRRDQIGIIFQFFNLIPTLTVLENVTLPQELGGQAPREIEAKALSLLEQVRLGDRAQAFPDKLSGGQQQRVAIVRALVHEPRLILADEPTGNLDEDTGKTVLELLLDLTRRADKTLIMATHNPEIATYADRVLRVHEGQLEDATADFCANDTTEAAAV